MFQASFVLRARSEDMESFLAPLSSAWHSYRKQRLLWWVTLFLLFPSLIVGDLIQSFFLQRELLPIAFLVLLVAIGLHVWGQACVLIGKNRRSFRTLLRDAQALIIPLLLTSLLRQCLTLLWGILLIIPGILFVIRTTLFDAVIAIEGQQYRPALRRSAFIVQTHTCRTLAVIIATYLIFFLPAYLFDLLPLALPGPLTESLIWNIGILVPKNMILAAGTALSLLTHIALYHELLSTGLATRPPPVPLEQYDGTLADD